MTRPLPVHVAEIRIVVDDDRQFVVLAELDVTGANYARCLDEGHFGLDLPGRGDGPDPTLDATVRIVARLRAHLADLIVHAEDPMAELLQHVFGEPGGLAHADAWRATDVTQQVAPGVSLGYRTAWATLSS